MVNAANRAADSATLDRLKADTTKRNHLAFSLNRNAASSCPAASTRPTLGGRIINLLAVDESKLETFL